MQKLEPLNARLPILSWCDDIDAEARQQAINLANHPTTVGFVALMPDCHAGYGMPIGGVIACKNAIIPNAVGVDIGCGMCAVQTTVEHLSKPELRQIINNIKERIPMGEGNAHKEPQIWDQFMINETKGFETSAIEPIYIRHKLNERTWTLAQKNLGTLGGGNHFIEIQYGNDGGIWLMLHSGSRNLGYQIARYYHNLAKELNKMWHSNLPCEDLAFLPIDHDKHCIANEYIHDMNFALSYAQENRKRMINIVKECLWDVKPFLSNEFNIHHNYANLENHLGQNLWIHRKGATSARDGQIGIIPGAMGSYSYIVKGRGVASSFNSCSHGAGRTMSRSKASATLNREDCDEAMKDIVWDGFKKRKGRKKQEDPKYDLSEAPQAYKNISTVMEAQKDLVEVVVELKTLAVLKG